MKKQIVTACALIASVAAFAASVQSDNTFGVLKVASTATDSASGQLIIPVPWENVGGGAVVATNYVLSTGRKTGDKLYWYDSSLETPAYKVWAIETNGGPWVPATTYTIGEKVYDVTAPAVGQAIARGHAVILGLVKGSSDPVYLSGQYNADTVKVEICGPTEADAAKLSRVSTLIAPSKASAVNLSEVEFYDSTGGTRLAGDALSTLKGDYIRLADGTTFTYSTTLGAWYKEGENGAPITDGLTIPAGQGAWYSRGNAGSIYVQW